MLPPSGGLEPPTFRLTVERASQLRHEGLMRNSEKCKIFQILALGHYFFFLFKYVFHTPFTLFKEFPITEEICQQDGKSIFLAIEILN